jgi:hypothetical protein
MSALRQGSPPSFYDGLNLVLRMGLELLCSTITVLAEVKLCQESLIFSLAQSISGASKSDEYS